MKTDIIQQTYKLAKAAREKHEDEISVKHTSLQDQTEIFGETEKATPTEQKYLTLLHQILCKI